ncbi:hypothetical protein GCM10009677_03830 [Sphaerisporangium rubeum]|uniref:Putative Ser/Thr protein kinase n=1 Tax=Sphaerisporangium rubeum TaxID=321317 RepID=A0A7X0I8W2_9ACTN|nr:putative Ser/Thr protein kinase [Sphaerisporangium rubeum]
MGREALRVEDPRRVGRFQIVARLGEGGQGVVYLGVADGGEQAAVKVFHSSVRVGQESGIVRELTAARQVAEFCTVRILEIGLEARPPYIASEYVEGPTLQHVIENDGPRHGAGLHRLAITTITALAAIHRAGVVHRDFKPGNVLIGADGPRVIDFGIARLTGASVTTGGAAGSPAYMAPEHFKGERIGPKADVFAWGSTIAYAATGAPPFGGDTLAAIAYRILHDEPDLGALPAPLRNVVAPCLAKDPALRPTAKDVLLRLLDDKGDTTAEVAVPVPAGGPDGVTAPGKPVSRRTLLASVAGGVVVAGGGAVLAYATARREEPKPPVTSPAGRSQASATPSPSPSRVAPPPANAIELAAAMDTAVTARPVADFSFMGGFAESSAFARASGRLAYGPAGPDGPGFDIRVRGSGERVVVLGLTGYAMNHGKKAFDLYAEPGGGERPAYAEAASMVAATASVLTILELIAASRGVRRKGRTYSASISTSSAGVGLHQLFGPWNANLDATYLSYSITIDGSELPTRFELTWKVPVGGAGFYESSFVTSYGNWRSGPPITDPT